MRLPSLAGGASATRRRLEAIRREAQRDADTTAQATNDATTTSAALEPGGTEEAARKVSTRDAGAQPCALGGAIATTLGEVLAEDMTGWEQEQFDIVGNIFGDTTTEDIIARATSCYAEIFCSSGKVCDVPGPEGENGRRCFAFLRVLMTNFSYAPLAALVGAIARRGKCSMPVLALGDPPNYSSQPSDPPNCTLLHGLFEVQPFIGPDGRCYRVRGFY